MTRKKPLIILKSIEDNKVNNCFKQRCKLIEPIFEAYERQVCSTKYLGADETPIKVLETIKKGTTHQGYYWVYYKTHNRQALFKFPRGRAAEWQKKH